MGRLPTQERMEIVQGICARLCEHRKSLDLLPLQIADHVHDHWKVEPQSAELYIQTLESGNLLNRIGKRRSRTMHYQRISDYFAAQGTDTAYASTLLAGLDQIDPNFALPASSIQPINGSQ